MYSTEALSSRWMSQRFVRAYRTAMIESARVRSPTCRLPAGWGLALLLLVSPAAAQDATNEIARHAEAAKQAQARGDFATAIQELTALARLLPERADVQSNLGLAYFFHNQPKEALAAFEKALRIEPDLVSALIFSGIAHQTLSEPARATPLLQRAIALEPADPLAHTWLAHSYVAQARPREAVDHFLIASRHAPRDVDVWYGLGQAYLHLGREAVMRLAEIAPRGARLAQLSGDIWLLRGEPQNALTMYEEALKRRPALVELTPVIDQLRQRQGTEPQRDLPAPARPTPDTSSPEDAQYLAATDFRERAQRAFEQISAIDPDSYRAHQVMAESLEAQERVDEAIDEYRRVLRAKPDLPSVHLAIGNLLMSEGRAREALDEYREELRVRPEESEVHYRMGRSFVVLGMADDGEASLTRALELADPPAAVQRELGRLYLTRGKAGYAVRALSKYVGSSDNDASAHYLLMQAYRALGDATAAERHLAIYERLSARDEQDASLKNALSIFSRR
ncbi:MAG: tetratricopeptide repeat protein [Luteitalea sp.]|nr:tetratricopeptide repeat protein [Luteitalea sp.]